MAPADYSLDFTSEASRHEFREMVAQAEHVWQAAAVPAREEAYERAGRYVVDHCDVLIGVWDGQPSRGRGGTQETLQYARDQGVPLLWITTSGEPRLRPELPAEPMKKLADAARGLHEFNAGIIRAPVFAAQMRRSANHLGLGCEAARHVTGPLRAGCQEMADWLLPFFVRSDLLALRLQRRFQVISMAMFAMAALAVTVVAVQVSFWPGDDWIAAFEVVLLLLLLAVPLLRNRLRLHKRWTSHRFLAERLRSAYFLALAGTGDRGIRRAGQASFSDPSVAWIERALAQITASRPQADLTAGDLRPLREYLGDFWIASQLEYHLESAERHEKWDDRLRRLTIALFAITLVSAVLHLLGVGHHNHSVTKVAELLIVLSISVPAIGAAVHGIDTLGMYRHHCERNRRMAVFLGQLRTRMGQAEDIEQVQSIAIDVERVMREESNDWFGVVRFHDVELIT